MMQPDLDFVCFGHALYFGMGRAQLQSGQIEAVPVSAKIDEFPLSKYEHNPHPLRFDNTLTAAATSAPGIAYVSQRADSLQSLGNSECRTSKFDCSWLHF
jgi:hypothetical protein